MAKVLQWAHEADEIIPGNYYRVWCAVVLTKNFPAIKEYKTNLDQFLLPVSPVLHKDDKFGVRHQHYHIDGRFRPVSGRSVLPYWTYSSDEGKNSNGVFMGGFHGNYSTI